MRPSQQSSLVTVVILGAAAFAWAVGCGDPPDNTPVITGISLGADKDVTVASTDPTGAEQGTILDVEVYGSGFDDGSVVEMGLGGEPSSKIKTNSTRYANPKKLIANITIETDALVELYDVIVTTYRGKKGMGTEMFQVRAGKTVIVEPTVIEYWIMEDPNVEGGSLIHMYGSGSVHLVNPQVVHDFFFNGQYDHPNYSQHYETYKVGVPAYPVEILPDGNFHADIPWNGEMDATELYRDHVVTDVAGTGADPFVFWYWLYFNDEVVLNYKARGVVMNGQLMGPEYTVPSGHPWHANASVASYAVFKGDDPDGYVWIEELRLSQPTCRKRRRVGEKVTRVGGEVYVKMGSTNGVPPSTWIEFHFADGSILTENVTQDVETGEKTFEMYREFPGHLQKIENLQLMVDFVRPGRDWSDYVYDPGRNSNAGFYTTVPAQFPYASKLGDPWPEARTAAIELPCQ